MFDHFDRMADAPSTGLISSRTIGETTSIVHIDPSSGRVSVIVDSSWSGVHPVWVSGHRAIAYGNGTEAWSSISACATNGQNKFQLTLWINSPQFRTFEPMFGDGFSSFSYLFRWSGDSATDTTAGIRGNTTVNIPREFGSPFNCRMSRDGRWIVCQATNAQGILRINRSTGEVQRVIETEAYEPALSPDGRKIVYGQWIRQSGVNPSQRIYLADVAEDGTITNPIIVAGPRFEHTVGSPVFSPDGKVVAYVFSDGGDSMDTIYYHMVSGDTNPQAIMVSGRMGRLDWQ
jgi:hypothetical protein